MITDTLKRELARESLSLESFQAIVQRLLGRQVLYRDPNNHRESELYDEFERMDDLVADFFEAMGLTLVHRTDQRFVIVYPPGAENPYAAEADDRRPALRQRVSRDATALLLVCRMRYEEALRGGETDENDEALVSLEDLYTGYRMVARESMPEGKVQREALFKTIQHYRVIEFHSLESEALVRIRPTITALTLEGFVEAAREAHGSSPHAARDAPWVATGDEDGQGGGDNVA